MPASFDNHLLVDHRLDTTMDLALTASQKKLVATGTGGVTTQNLVSALDIVNFLVQDFRYRDDNNALYPNVYYDCVTDLNQTNYPPYTMAAATL